jgi:hypothetical protein
VSVIGSLLVRARKLLLVIGCKVGRDWTGRLSVSRCGQHADDISMLLIEVSCYVCHQLRAVKRFATLQRRVVRHYLTMVIITLQRLISHRVRLGRRMGRRFFDTASSVVVI